MSEPLLASPRGGTDRIPLSASATCVTMLASVAALLTLGFGLSAGRSEFVALAVVLPVVLIHDLLRYQAFWRSKPHVAMVLDGGWVVGTVALWPVVTTHHSAAVAVECWGAAAVLGIAMSLFWTRPKWCRIESAISWWKNRARSLAGPMALDSIVYALAAQAIIFVVGTIAGSSEVGIMRAGQVYFMPVSLMLTGCASMAIPHLAQNRHQMTRAMCRLIALGLTGLAALVCSLIVIAEPLLRGLLYAHAVDVPRSLIVPLALQVIVSTHASASVIFAKARQRGNDLVGGRVSSTIVGLVLLVPATLHWGVVGAAWALVGHALTYAVHLHLRARRSPFDAADQEIGARSTEGAATLSDRDDRYERNSK